ncbi:MAG: decaprenyl-phosphate phosphoribosyltransferase [Deltaproteobacteria bacterium]|nr:decaprenyl-phosphate phosphoribosyltransferase [Deltaproteobacteria bacterium]
MNAYIQILRPRQWLKNLMLLFPPLFGGILFTPDVIHNLALPLLAFCLASSANYVINDVLDEKQDACHPVKSKRPIPSGAITPQTAVIFGCILFILAIVMGLFVSLPFLLTLLAYLILSSAYSFKLKDIPVVDIFCVSAGFLLRLHAGGLAYGVPISNWLFLTVFLLSLFLSLGKRIAEKQLLGEKCACHRPVLEAYPMEFLHGTMYMTGATVLVTYAMYVVTHPGLLYTIPLCCFGLFRYMYRVIKNASGDPTEALFQDKVLLVIGLTWFILVAWGIYR